MEKIERIRVVGLCITLLLISSALSVATTVTETSTVRKDAAPSLSEPLSGPGSVVFTKNIWDPTGMAWTKTVNASVGDTVQFNISLTFYTNNAFNKLYNIKIKDILPECLEFVEGSIIFINASKPNDTGIFNKTLYWNWTKAELNMSNDSSMGIEFTAKVVESVQLENENKAWINATECSQYWHEAQDSAWVKIKVPYIHVEKLVWNGNEWTKEFNETVHMKDLIQFKIITKYRGIDAIKNMVVCDLFPNECLEYAGNVEITTTGIAGDPVIEVSGDNKTVYWNWTTSANLYLQDRDSLTITFDAKVAKYCLDKVTNHVNVSAWGCCPPDDMVNDTDEANITCRPPATTFKKKVWDPTGKTWVDDLHTIVGATVRFQLTLTYYGNTSLYNIHVVDQLPCCLEYADNATTTPTSVALDKRTIWWNFTDKNLSDSETLTIEYDANVTTPSGCGDGSNFAQVTADEYNDGVHIYEATANITAYNNQPPDRPNLRGDTSGTEDEELTFYVIADNYQEDKVWYLFDWDDGTSEAWIGPFTQGIEIPVTHTWTDDGPYMVKAKAKDKYDAESNWSFPLPVTITENEPKTNLKIRVAFGSIGVIRARIRNSGDADAQNITWTISVNGGIRGKINISAFGTLDTLEAGRAQTVRTRRLNDGRIHGLGRVNITVTATAPDIIPVIITAKGMVVGPFVIVYSQNDV